MEDDRVTVLAGVGHTSSEMRIAVATRLGVPGAASLTENELIASNTNALMKQTVGEHNIQTCVERLLSVTEAKKQPPRHEATQVTVQQELRLNLTSYTCIRQKFEGALKRGYSK